MKNARSANIAKSPSIYKYSSGACSRHLSFFKVHAGNAFPNILNAFMHRMSVSLQACIWKIFSVYVHYINLHVCACVVNVSCKQVCCIQRQLTLIPIYKGKLHIILFLFQFLIFLSTYIRNYEIRYRMTVLTTSRSADNYSFNLLYATTIVPPFRSSVLKPSLDLGIGHFQSFGQRRPLGRCEIFLALKSLLQFDDLQSRERRPRLLALRRRASLIRVTNAPRCKETSNERNFHLPCIFINAHSHVCACRVSTFYDSTRLEVTLN